MTGPERRHPRITLHDVRRDLREADEERFRLTRQVRDWRHPRIGIQDLRRDLREADQERFQLTMRVRSLSLMVKRGGTGVFVLLMAAGGFAAWAAHSPASQPQASTPAGPAITSDATSADRSQREALTSADVSGTGKITPISNHVVEPAVSNPRIERPAARRPVRIRRVTTKTTAKFSAPAIRPRPLTPGEFGRKYTRDRSEFSSHFPS
jgi:hypothetical protein